MTLKKIICLAMLIHNGFAFAKKVKFSVDMTGQVINSAGVHISGNFQDEAGFPSDWDSKATPLTKENGTNIYSVIVNIPAFRTYQYKFVNGELFYEVEFVPEKSRVGFDFNDNRWIYIDSTNNDTTFLPALIFGGNAPIGKKMIRFKLDLSTQTINQNNGIHVSTNFNNWNAGKSNLVSFSNKVFEGIEYTDSTNIEYIFVNDFIYEQVPAACGNNDKNRFLTIDSDTVLEEICFSECADCVSNNIKLISKGSFALLYPNPSKGICILKFNNHYGMFNVYISDYMGRQIIRCENASDELLINTEYLNKGIYFINISNAENLQSVIKLIVN